MSIKTLETSSIKEKEFIDQKEIKSIYEDVLSVVKSRNPLDFYLKIKTIKKEIAKIIKSIVDEVVELFDINNKSKMNEMYYQTWYGENIKNHLKYYIEQSKYFDVRFYFIAVVLFDKEKQYLIKSLIKLYKKTADKDIEKYLKKFSHNISLNQTKSIFRKFKIEKMRIKEKYIDENKSYLFMEKVFLLLRKEEDRSEFLESFKIYMDNFNFVRSENWKQVLFQELIRIFWYITRNYIKTDKLDGQKDMEYLNKNINIKIALDQEIENYLQNKNSFYKNIVIILTWEDIEKKTCWRYIRTQMINKYFPEAKKLFYWNCIAEFQNNRRIWNSLAVDSEGIDDAYIKKLCDFKNLIISIQSNVFWTFWKPIVYSLILDTLKVDKKGYDKMFFIMCFIVANNYWEYRQLYRFFNEIRIIYWFDNNRNSYNIIWKINLSMSLLVLAFFIFWWLFTIAPFGLFVALLGLAIIYYLEYLSDNTISSRIKINLWLKAYLTIAAIIFGFTFVINLWKQIDNWWSYSKKLNNISQMTTPDAISHVIKWDFFEYSADILENGKKSENEQLSGDNSQWVVDTK